MGGYLRKIQTCILQQVACVTHLLFTHEIRRRTKPRLLKQSVKMNATDAKLFAKWFQMDDSLAQVLVNVLHGIEHERISVLAQFGRLRSQDVRQEREAMPVVFGPALLSLFKLLAQLFNAVVMRFLFLSGADSSSVTMKSLLVEMACPVDASVSLA